MMENGTDRTNYYADLEDLPPQLQESIINIIKAEGYVTCKVEKKIFPQVGNFTSILYEVDITGETTDGEKVTPLFIKEPVVIDKIKTAHVPDLYRHELFIYNDLFKVYSGLQDAANIPQSEKNTFLTQYENSYNCVIMENLSKKGFKTYDKTERIPLRFVELSIIRLAKLHAFSYTVKKKVPKYFEDKIKVIRNVCDINSDLKEFIHNVCAAAAQVFTGETTAKVSNYAKRMIEMLIKYVYDDVPINGCLCHGDYKFHNILVKEVDGEPTEVLPIDYQLSYYGNPVNDFLFFIYTSTNRDFRKKHLSYLKDLYFENFARFLSFFDIDVDSTYSRQEFEEDYEERLEMGLVFGLFLSAFTYAHFDEGFDVTKKSLSELPIVPDKLFTDCVRGIVEDYIEWGYL